MASCGVSSSLYGLYYILSIQEIITPQSSAYGIRTRDSGVKGRRLKPLVERAMFSFVAR